MSSIGSARRLVTVEVEAGRVHAVAQAGGLGAVLEHVAQVRMATGAPHLGADHSVAGVADELDLVVGDWLPEARPAAARVVLGAGCEERLAAGDAAVGALVLG